jgi:cellulose synthase operon protein C
MTRTLNFKFLAILLGGLVVFGTGVHFLHGFQVKRNAGTLLQRAGRAEDEGHLEQAADFLGRYLTYEPGNTDALARYGLLLDKLAKSPRAQLRAYLVLDRVLQLEPQRADVRRRAAQVAIDLRCYTDAKDHLEVLAKAAPKDAELEELLGKCEAGRGEYLEARKHFQNAVRLAPERITSYALFAWLLQSQPDKVKNRDESAEKIKKLADDSIEAMVKANAQSFRAYLERARYRRQFHPGGAEKALREAEQDTAKARRLAPEEAEVFLVSADVAQDRGDRTQERGDRKQVGDYRKQARDYLRAGCAKKPKDVRMYLVLAALEVKDGQPKEAVACLRQGLERLPKQEAAQDHTALLWELANVLIQAEEPGEAAAVAKRLREENFQPALLDYLDARLLMARKEWLRAAWLLERSYPLLGEPQATQQAGLLLAHCYERLGDTDRAYAAYGRVVLLNPRSSLARLGEARSLAAMGQVPDAVVQYRQLLKLPEVPAAALTELAGLLITLNRQANQPDWAEVDEVLAHAEKVAPSSAVTILQAEVLALKKEPDKARAKLEKSADDKAPRPVEVWAALAALEDSQAKPEAALALLDAAERQLGDRVELRLARARHWAGRNGDEARKALDRLLSGADKFTAEEQQALLRGVATAYARVGATDEAQRLWDRLAEQRQDDLSVRIAQFDLALAAGNDAAVEPILQAMRGIEGEEGTVWRYARATHLLRTAKPGDAGALNEAEALLALVADRRPWWSRVALSQARVQDLRHKDLRKKTEAALPLYLRAIQLGERGPAVVGRAVELLSAAGRYPEAYELTRKLPREAEAPLSADLQKVVAAVSLQTGHDTERALELARKVVDRGSKDYREHLWLGRMLLLSGQRKEAEPAFRRAVELAETTPEAWVALVEYLVGMDRKEDAEREIARAERKLPRDQAALALAHCYEAVGRKERAKELYESALKARPDDVPTLLAVTGFCLGSGGAEGVKAAQAHLEKILALRPEDPEVARRARNTLAVVRTLSGDYRESRSALKLLGVGGDSALPEQPETESAEDLRTKAGLLALQRDRKERRQAVALLERLVRRPEATPGDHLLLAQLYESTGDWPKARARLAKLLSLPGGEAPRYLAHYARSLLRHEDTAEAQVWLEKLEKLKPEAGPRQAREVQAREIEAQAKELRARLLKAQGKGREAVELLTKYAETKDVNVGSVAAVLESLKEPEAAERLYRQYVEASRGKNPEAVLVLASFLGRQRRVPQALDLCEGAPPTCRPLAVAQALIYVVSQPPADAVQLARAERWLRAAAEKDPKSSSLAAALAHVHNLQGRYDLAEAVYRKAIQTNPNDAMALNNLAFLLALRDRAAESLKLVDDACQAAGPHASLLDTRGVVRLKMKDSRRAIQDLNDAVAEAPSASLYFHLAQAHSLAQDRDNAKRAWRQARAMGLEASRLHPLERAAYEELARQLDELGAAPRRPGG